MDKKITIKEKALDELETRLSALSAELSNLEHRTKVARMEVDLIASMLSFIKESDHGKD